MVKIVKASYEIIDKEDIDPKKIAKRIEKIARVCYKSEGLISMDESSAFKMLKLLAERKHFPMFDHCHISVKFTIDRGVSHELVRHRIAAYAQESTRYCNYSKGKFDNQITVIEPDIFIEDIKNLKPIRLLPDNFDERESEVFKRAEKLLKQIHYENLEEKITADYLYNWLMDKIELIYYIYTKNGYQPQIARSILPNSLKTEIVATMDLTEWHHVFTLRCAKEAHPDMRKIMLPILEEFHTLIPIVYDELYEKYKVDIAENFLKYFNRDDIYGKKREI